MVRAALITGVLLFLLGLLGYYGSAEQHLTAFIPGIMGILMMVAGLVGLKPSLRMHAMHGAALIAILGIIGPGMRLPKLFQAEEASPLAIATHLLTVLVCLGFFILAIQSFLKARRDRKALAAVAKDAGKKSPNHGSSSKDSAGSGES